QQLVCAFVLVDIRHEPQKVDLEFMEWMGENQIPFCLIFTKADKLKPKAIENHVNTYLKTLLEGVWEEAPKYFVTSSSNGQGKEELLAFIEDININYFKEIK
ncbi:MAG: YihA family ribosome biogenesis GTP-binding protein, partial [Arenibacter sp.]|nr:YihA family ribosome biogenesis GTP-binding protein [Arenibacter sp.]